MKPNKSFHLYFAFVQSICDSNIKETRTWQGKICRLLAALWPWVPLLETVSRHKANPETGISYRMVMAGSSISLRHPLQCCTLLPVSSLIPVSLVYPSQSAWHILCTHCFGYFFFLIYCVRVYVWVEVRGLLELSSVHPPWILSVKLRLPDLVSSTFYLMNHPTGPGFSFKW